MAQHGTYVADRFGRSVKGKGNENDPINDKYVGDRQNLSERKGYCRVRKDSEDQMVGRYYYAVGVNFNFMKSEEIIKLLAELLGDQKGVEIWIEKKS